MPRSSLFKDKSSNNDLGATRASTATTTNQDPSSPGTAEPITDRNSSKKSSSSKTAIFDNNNTNNNGSKTSIVNEKKSASATATPANATPTATTIVNGKNISTNSKTGGNNSLDNHSMTLLPAEHHHGHHHHHHDHLQHDGTTTDIRGSVAHRVSTRVTHGARDLIKKSQKPIPLHREVTTDPLQKFKKYGRLPCKLILNIIIAAMLTVLIFGVIAPRLIAIEHQRKSLYTLIMPDGFLTNEGGSNYVSLPTAYLHSSTAFRNFLKSVTENYYSLPATSPGKYRPFVESTAPFENGSSWGPFEDPYLNEEEDNNDNNEDQQDNTGGEGNRDGNQNRLRKSTASTFTERDFVVEEGDDEREIITTTPSTTNSRKKNKNVIEVEDETAENSGGLIRSGGNNINGETPHHFQFFRPNKKNNNDYKNKNDNKNDITLLKGSMMNTPSFIKSNFGGEQNTTTTTTPSPPPSATSFHRQPARMTVTMLSSNGRITAQPNQEDLVVGVPMTLSHPYGLFTPIDTKDFPKAHNKSWLTACTVRRAVESTQFGFDAAADMFFPCRAGDSSIENNIFDLTRQVEVEFYLYSFEYRDALTGGEGAVRWKIDLICNMRVNGLIQITIKTSATSTRHSADFSTWMLLAVAILVISIWDGVLRIRAGIRIHRLEVHLQQHEGFLSRQPVAPDGTGVVGTTINPSGSKNNLAKLLVDDTNEAANKGTTNNNSKDFHSENPLMAASQKPSASALAEHNKLLKKQGGGGKNKAVNFNDDADDGDITDFKIPDEIEPTTMTTPPLASPVSPGQTTQEPTSATMKEDNNTSSDKNNKNEKEKKEKKKKQSELSSAVLSASSSRSRSVRTNTSIVSSSSSSSSDSSDSSYDELGNRKKRALRWKNELRRNFGMGWIYFGVVSDLLNVICAALFILDSTVVSTNDNLRYIHTIFVGLAVLFSYSLLTSYLRYFPKLYLFLAASDIASPVLRRFLIICVPVVVGSSMFGHVMFGAYAAEASSFLEMMTFLVASAFGDSLNQMFQTFSNSDHWGYRLVGRLYAFIFISYYYFVLNNLAAAIAVNAYGYVQERFAVHKDKGARAVLMKKSMSEQLDSATAKACASMKHLSMVLKKYENEQACEAEMDRARVHGQVMFISGDDVALQDDPQDNENNNMDGNDDDGNNNNNNADQDSTRDMRGGVPSTMLLDALENNDSQNPNELGHASTDLASPKFDSSGHLGKKKHRRSGSTRRQQRKRSNSRLGSRSLFNRSGSRMDVNNDDNNDDDRNNKSSALDRDNNGNDDNDSFSSSSSASATTQEGFATVDNQFIL